MSNFTGSKKSYLAFSCKEESWFPEQKVFMRARASLLHLLRLNFFLVALSMGLTCTPSTFDRWMEQRVSAVDAIETPAKNSPKTTKKPWKICLLSAITIGFCKVETTPSPTDHSWAFQFETLSNGSCSCVKEVNTRKPSPKPVPDRWSDPVCFQFPHWCESTYHWYLAFPVGLEEHWRGS